MRWISASSYVNILPCLLYGHDSWEGVGMEQVSTPQARSGQTELLSGGTGTALRVQNQSAETISRFTDKTNMLMHTAVKEDFSPQ